MSDAAPEGGGAPDALETERARYRELFEFVPAAQLVTDANGLILEANRAAAALFGMTDARFVLGKPLATFVLESDRRRFRRSLLQLDAAPRREEWELQLETRTLPPVPVEITVGPAHAGATSGDLRWLIRTLDERVRAEDEIRRLASELEERALERSAALAEEQARLVAVVEHIPIGLTVVDASGGVVVANSEALRILRVPVLERLGPDESWEGWREDGTAYAPGEWPLERSLRTGEVVTDERAEIIRGGGGRVTLDLSAAPIRDAGGKTIGAVAVFHDVTVRERQERAERDFVTNAAHELQTPLAAIMSAVEVLQSGAKDTDQRDLFLGHVERETARLARLVRALLVLARAQTGVESPRVEVVALAPLLAEIAARLAPAPGVAVEVSCPNDLAVMTNRDLVDQAIANIARNAARYTGKGAISMDAGMAGGRVQISVTDTGAGIARSEQARVFDRFYGSFHGGGFGLGLSLVRAAMEVLDGSVELDSDVGKGTTVRLTLPVAATLLTT
jgi:PAS domain S-box-containing protein